MTKFIAEPSFWELFPQAEIGVVVARGMKQASAVSEADAQEIAALLADANKAAQKHLTSETISENAPVRAWRQAYAKFKTKRGARCSVENLLKRVLKDKPVGSITPTVDLYNKVSLTYAVPVGGEDLDAFVGDLRLSITAGGDTFRALGEDKDDPTLDGELCYRDQEGAVCRCFNWRDAQRTALTDESTNGFFVIECVDPTHAPEMRAATDELAALFERYLGAEIAVTTIITQENPQVEIA